MVDTRFKEQVLILSSYVEGDLGGYEKNFKSDVNSKFLSVSRPPKSAGYFCGIYSRASFEVIF